MHVHDEGRYRDKGKKENETGGIVVVEKSAWTNKRNSRKAGNSKVN